MKTNKQIKKLLTDHKSSFYKFIHQNNGLKTLGRDYIKDSNEELYQFFISGKDPNWIERMKKTNWKEKMI